MLTWYRRLIALRRTWPDLRSDGPDDTRAQYDESAGSLRVQRGAAVVAVNTGDVAASIPVGDGVEIGVTNDDGALVADGWLALAPCSVAVLVPAAVSDRPGARS